MTFIKILMWNSQKQVSGDNKQHSRNIVGAQGFSDHTVYM